MRRAPASFPSLKELVGNALLQKQINIGIDDCIAAYANSGTSTPAYFVSDTSTNLVVRTMDLRSEDHCSICGDDEDESNSGRTNCCKQLFHEGYMRKWAADPDSPATKTCPLCRAEWGIVRHKGNFEDIEVSDVSPQFRPGQAFDLPLLSWGPGREDWRFLTPELARQATQEVSSAEQTQSPPPNPQPTVPSQAELDEFGARRAQLHADLLAGPRDESLQTRIAEYRAEWAQIQARFPEPERSSNGDQGLRAIQAQYMARSARFQAELHAERSSDEQQAWRMRYDEYWAERNDFDARRLAATWVGILESEIARLGL